MIEKIPARQLFTSESVTEGLANAAQPGSPPRPGRA